MRRLMESGKVESVMPKDKPWISETNRKKRLAFCYAHRHWTEAEWGRVIWSDESPFTLRCQSKRRVWKPTAEEFARFAFHGTVKHQKKINVWGCFSRHGVGALYRINGIMDKEMYHQILIHQFVPSSKTLFPNDNFIFQQDNDPKHTSKLVQGYIQRKGWEVFDWPSQSPDINPIENLWYILDRETKDRLCQNEDDLFKTLEKLGKILV
jgi:hypothetical protein